MSGILLLLMANLAACTGPKVDGERRDRTPRRVRQLEQPNEYVIPGLIETSSEIATVQLHRQPIQSCIPMLHRMLIVAV